MRAFDENTASRQWTHDVPALLALDAVGTDHYRNRHHQPNAYHALFGGQIVAQALAATDRTVEPDKRVHSLHCYFLRAGSDASLIDYHVERMRDGRRFSARRVTAVQDGKLIFSMECSYRAPIAGFSHFRPATVPFTPEEALGGEALRAVLGAINPSLNTLFLGNYPIEVRLPGTAGFVETTAEARRHYWLRAPGAERVDDPAVHRQILAFLSDFLLAGAPLAPHTVALPGPHLFVASLDHAVWFHRDVRCDDWLLFETEGPNARDGVNLAQAFVYNRAGELVATLAQEAMQYGIDTED